MGRGRQGGPPEVADPKLGGELAAVLCRPEGMVFSAETQHGSREWGSGYQFCWSTGSHSTTAYKGQGRVSGRRLSRSLSHPKKIKVLFSCQQGAMEDS